MQRFLIIVISLFLTSLYGCGGSGNAGNIFDPNPPGGGGPPGGPGPTKGPSAAPTPGALSLNGSPSIQNVSPNGLTNISIETPVCITFSESLQTATVTSTTLVLRVQQGQAVQATISNFGGGRFFVIVPNAPLPTNRTIEVVASSLIRDIDGNGLTIPTGGIVGSFTTELTADATKTPRVLAAFPPNNAKNIPPGTPNVGTGVNTIPGTPSQMVVVFSEPIAPSTILGDLTPPPGLDKIGLTIIETVDPDGSGPANPIVTPLVPGTGAFLLPFNDNRVWVATPLEPFDPGASVTMGVGPGTKNDDVQPMGVDPVFSSSFTIANLEAPQFVNVDITPATPTELALIPAFLNNVPTLPNNSANPTFAGKFTVGVLFGPTSLATDTLEIQIHDATSPGTVLFSKKAKLGGGQLNYSDLSILDKNGVSRLQQGIAVLAARTRRGSATSAWTLGLPVSIDTTIPSITAFGPPSEGATLLAFGRLSSIYGTASESPFALAFTQIESPVGTIGVPPIPAGLSGHLLSTNGNFFYSLPLVPAPPVETPSTIGTPPNEPKAKATVIVSDLAGNTSTAQDVNVIFRGRMGGASLASQQALTVIVFDEDTLATVTSAVVLLDEAAPTGTGTGQTTKSVSLSGTTGLTQATFVAGTDFSPLATQLTVTAAAPGYDMILQLSLECRRVLYQFRSAGRAER
ncbi:MAG: Ig-like domain-containing protein [Planctomycetota bacterium]